MKNNTFRLIVKTLFFIGTLSLAALSQAKVSAKPVTIPMAETVASFQEGRPGNPSITPDGRILVSLHPFDKPKTKIVEVYKDGSMKLYPNASFADGDNSQLKAVIAIRTDNQGVAWILDFAEKRLYGWDTRAEKMVKTIDIPKEVLLEKSFLQDFALDQKRHRIIIADMTQIDLKSAPSPAFIVVDLKSGAARRLAQNHSALMPEKQGGLALNPITIDPAYQWVYFGAVHGHTLYRAPAAAFDSADLVNKIEKYGPKPDSDGISVDKAGNVYITDIESHAIGVTNKKGYRVIAKIPEGQSWPDGMSFGPDNYLYITVNQLDRSAALNQGEEKGWPPFKLVRIKSLASSAVGR